MGKINEGQILTFIGDLKYKINNLTEYDGKPMIGKKKPKKPIPFSSAILVEITSSTASILSKIYGTDQYHLNDFDKKVKECEDLDEYIEYHILCCCLGKLNALENDIKLGLTGSLEKQISGEVFGDFINAAKASSHEGQKDIAAVLACAALEDLLKRLAILNGLNVNDKTMSDVVNILKSKSLIKGPQSKLIGAYVTLRNKTFHAEWDKIEAPEVKSLISFTEEMLVHHFN